MPGFKINPGELNRLFRRFGLLILICLFPAFIEGQTSATLNPDSGGFEKHTYTNRYFGFTYKLNDEWFVNQDLMAQDAQRPNKMAGRFLLVILDRHTGTPLRERVMIIADDESLYHPPLNGAKDYVTRLLDAQVRRGNERVGEVFSVEHAGKPFYCAEFNEKFPGGALHKAFLATERGGFLLSWVFASSSSDSLALILKSLDQISFAPVVPGEQKPVSADTPSVPPRRIRISQMVLEGIILEKRMPPYPEAARKNKVEGLVRLHVLISRTGELKTAEVVEGDPLLGQAALDGVRYWKFKPYLLNGEPVEVDSQITVDFRLSKDKPL